MARGRLRVGTSGYHYGHWRGAFYPKELATPGWFEYYARHFSTVEINNTFYRLPESKTFDAWRNQAPEGFCYALKFSRYATHVKRLKASRQVVKHFLERANLLDDRLGPILVQLPPNWNPDVERLGHFLEAAPRTHRWALEFRDPRWLCEPIYELLRNHGAALCLHDLLDDHPREITTQWVYLRFHGEGYGGSYSPQFLSAQARRIRCWLEEGLDVYVYFNNDLEGRAIQNALDLRRYASGE
jgi:uncharacterized protein YecE (DUF72 family)